MIPGFVEPTAICRHSSNDPACSSNRGTYVAPCSRLHADEVKADPRTPDADNYEVVDAVTVGRHLVMKVKYPNCASCAFEGTKVLVYLNVTPLQAMKWRRIDPHFREPGEPVPANEAPGPDARFPASTHGWEDALAYADKIGGSK